MGDLSDGRLIIFESIHFTIERINEQAKKQTKRITMKHFFITNLPKVVVMAMMIFAPRANACEFYMKTAADYYVSKWNSVNKYPLPEVYNKADMVCSSGATIFRPGTDWTPFDCLGGAGDRYCKIRLGTWHWWWGFQQKNFKLCGQRKTATCYENAMRAYCGAKYVISKEGDGQYRICDDGDDACISGSDTSSCTQTIG